VVTSTTSPSFHWSGVGDAASVPRRVILPMSAVSLGAFQQSGSSGRYYPIAKLGRGGMSEVYLTVARGPAGFNKLVVIKRLLSDLVAETHFLEMFLDEARLAARLNHPNVVQTNEVGASDETYFIAMEYLDGQPLQKIMRRLLPRPLPVSVALSIAADVSAGLHYAHTLTDFGGAPLGIVHRDVSPQNIFVTYAGQVKIVDFGIAKAAGQTTETASGALKGKIAYMSPEQISGAPLDGRADIFSLGIVLYEALTGRRIWGSPMQDVDVVRRLVMGDVPCSPRSIVPDLPEDVDRICQRALAVDRRDRYASALEMQKELEASIARLPQRISERDVGEMVANMFDQERQSIARVIDNQLSLMDAMSDEFTLGSLPTLSVQSGIMSLTPAQDVSAARLRSPKSPWLQGGTVLIVAALFGVLAAFGIWRSFDSRSERGKAPAELPSAPATLPSATAAIKLPVPTEAPKADDTKDALPMRNPAPPVQVRRARAHASAPALAPPPRRSSATALPRSPAGNETPAPAPAAPPRAAPAPTYGPLDDRR
jgi:serine/threonine protein kinase